MRIAAAGIASWAGRPRPKASAFASPGRRRTTGRGLCRTGWRGLRLRERTMSSKTGTSCRPANRKSGAVTHSPARVRSGCTVPAAAAARIREIGARLVQRCDAIKHAIEECPRPRSCGKTNHIQWVRFRFATLPARQKRPAWAATKRSRSRASAAVNASAGCVSYGSPKISGHKFALTKAPAR